MNRSVTPPVTFSCLSLPVQPNASSSFVLTKTSSSPVKSWRRARLFQKVVQLKSKTKIKHAPRNHTVDKRFFKPQTTRTAWSFLTLKVMWEISRTKGWPASKRGWMVMNGGLRKYPEYQDHGSLTRFKFKTASPTTGFPYVYLFCKLEQQLSVLNLNYATSKRLIIKQSH